MWAVRPSEAVTQAKLCPDISPAREDSCVVLLVRHGRIRPTALLEGLHGPSFPPAQHSGACITNTVRVLVLVTHHFCWSTDIENIV